MLTAGQAKIQLPGSSELFLYSFNLIKHYCNESWLFGATYIKINIYILITLYGIFNLVYFATYNFMLRNLSPLAYLF